MIGDTLEDVLRLFRDVCQAVQYAHQRGIIHRDLKPSNILVDHEGRPKILDFGLARQLAVVDDLTASGQVMGTLPYMSPEQARGDTEQISALTDVYALGVILFRLLSGQFPYPIEGTQYEIIHHILNTPPTSLSSAWSPEEGIPIRMARYAARGTRFNRDVETIVLTALAKEPERRYQSVGELAEDVRRFLNGEPINARRDSTWYVLRKLAYRHRKATIVASAVSCIIISTAVISTYFYVDSREALRDRTAIASRFQKQATDLEKQAADVKLALHRQTFGWFLNAWNEDELDVARDIMRKTPQTVPEHAAMRYLLDSAYTTDQLLADLSQAEPLAYFTAGERARKTGESETARQCYERSISAKETGMLAQMARARLEELSRAKTAQGGAP